MYGVVHKVSIAYHPHTNDQAKELNREIKKLLQKMNDWSRLLEHALWAHRTTYRTPLRMSPYQIVFGKACHLSIEIERQAYWELEEPWLEAYENYWIYKRNIKQFHDNRILRKEFKVGQKLFLFNSRLKLIVAHYKPKSQKTMINLNLVGQRSFGIILGVGST
ncbi:hypothetical protein CR513_27373, partial [Mucuna pruriens]